MEFTYDRVVKWWLSDCGKYTIWIQSRPRESGSWWAAQYLRQKPWLIDHATKAGAIEACEKHAEKVLRKDKAAKVRAAARGCHTCVKLLSEIANCVPVSLNGGSLYESYDCNYRKGSASVGGKPVAHDRSCLHGRIKRHLKRTHFVF